MRRNSPLLAATAGVKRVDPGPPGVTDSAARSIAASGKGSGRAFRRCTRGSAVLGAFFVSALLGAVACVNASEEESSVAEPDEGSLDLTAKPGGDAGSGGGGRPDGGAPGG